MAGSDDEATEIRREPVGIGVMATNPAALLGRTLGKFTICERLGRGGAAEVFRAEQPALGRSAVIKVLRPAPPGSNRVERFLREAKLASRLDHPYAAHMYAFGAEADGVLWIAMEYVRGVTLDELVARRGAMPPAVFAPLFARLCEVVHTAHELGIVHRDIKGSNVMVIERAGQLLPKLLDFGIAKGAEEDLRIADEDDARDDALTVHGSTLGSPHYMSPEQWDAPADVDARADIYALGVLAFRCVSGDLPFRTVERPQLPDAHRHAPVPPLPDEVPAPLAEVITRAMAKAPGDRWPTALAFGDAVRVSVGGAAPEAVPIFDRTVRDAWLRDAPQPIADAVARLADADTAVDADVALRALVAIACRWLAVIELSQLAAKAAADELAAPDAGASSSSNRAKAAASPSLAATTAAAATTGAAATTAAADDRRDDAMFARLRDAARAVAGRDDANPWLELARVADAALGDAGLAGVRSAIAGADGLATLAARLDDRAHPRTLASLAFDMAAVADALRPLAPLLAYRLAVWREGAAESWQGARRRERMRVMVWGEPLPDGLVALLDAQDKVALVLSPLVQVVAPAPAAEPELFVLWRSGRGGARLVAAPWGFERDDDAAARRLAQLTTEDHATADDPGDDSPYPGLAAYGRSDADRFVGREREVEAVANRLVRAPALAVLGPSGAGKSSFLYAGVVPRLAEHYEVIALRPGRHPLHALAAHPAVGCAGVPVAEQPEAIAAKLRERGEAAPRGLVVAIDQFEELVTLCTDAAERAAFAHALALAADDTAAPVRIIATLRDDFASAIESEDGLRGRFDVFVLAAPAPEALRRIVTEPARRAGVSVDPDVVREMVEAVAGRPASLPLLSFTAAQLWRARDRVARAIHREAYAQLGGVAGALGAYADEVYGSLGAREQEIARTLFARLVAADGTRIPVPRAELEQLAGAASVLGHLVDARLLVAREDDAADRGTPARDIVELVHECLAERWPRLARWRNEDAADRALLGDVRTATRRWREAGDDLLWRGEALAQLQRLASRAALTDDERAFVAASARAETRSRRRRRALVAGAMTTLALVAVALAYLGWRANTNRAAAERSASAADRAAADARAAAALAEERYVTSLVAQGRRELNDNHAFPALAYLGEALRRGVDTPAVRELITLAARAWPAELLVVRRTASTEEVAGNGWFAAGTADGKLRVWRVGPGTPPALEATGEIDAQLQFVTWLGLQRDGTILALGRNAIASIDPLARTVRWRIATKSAPLTACIGADASIAAVEAEQLRIYDRTGKLLRELALPDAGDRAEPHFDAVCTRVALGGDHQATVLDLATFTRHVVGTNVAGELAVPPHTADQLAWLDRDGIAHVVAWDGTERAHFRPKGAPHTLMFAPDGSRLGALGDHDLGVYTVTGEMRFGIGVEAMPTAIQLGGGATGDDAWLGDTAGVIRHYVRGMLVGSYPSQLTDVSAIEADARLAITTGNDGSLVVLRADRPQLQLKGAPCERPAEILDEGEAVVYDCGAKRPVYVGTHLVGDAAGRAFVFARYDQASGRALIAGDSISVIGPDGAIVAHEDRFAGIAAFEDADHVVVADRTALWRWSLPDHTWSQLAPWPEVEGIAIVRGGTLVATRDGALVLLHGTREVHRELPGSPTHELSASGDGRWAAAQLADGTTALVDGTTGTIARRLPPADATGGVAVLDEHGDLVLRPAGEQLVLYDRATGDALATKLDLIEGALGARFLPDGRLELAAYQTGVLDLPRDLRPAADLVREIDARVPLRVVAGRLEPR
ncbi:MAG TPA: serine/threonine-protein kinase [Kofleriaceae bacterium]